MFGSRLGRLDQRRGGGRLEAKGARRTGNTRPVVVGRRVYVEAAIAEPPIPQIPEELKQHPCIVYTSWGNLRGFITHDGSAVAARVGGPLQTNTSEIVRAAVLGGVRIACSPAAPPPPGRRHAAMQSAGQVPG